MSSLLIVAALAAQLSAAPPAPDIKDLRWMSGTWMSARPKTRGIAEEVWSAPRAGAMVGMFRLIEGGQIRFYELQTITVEKGKLVLRIRHFDKLLTPWKKEKTPLTYTANGVEGNKVVFSHPTDKVERIEYHRRSNQGMLVRLVLRGSGKTIDFKFGKPAAKRRGASATGGGDARGP